MKKNRHSEIIEIIQANSITTQDELITLLKDRGFDVTQATVSRDIRELRLVKMTDQDGNMSYSLPSAGTEPIELRRYYTILHETVYHVATAGNLVVIRCYVGMANAAAAAFDALNFENVVGTIAGDDTIFVAVNTVENAEELQSQLKAMI